MSGLSFLAPGRLWLLVLPVLLVVAYLVRQRTRERYAVRFTNLALLDEIAPERPGWRRHLPAAALALGVVAAVLAFAKPAVAEVERDSSAVVVLAIDVSLSMEATDVAPSRLEAAQDAARSFLDSVPEGVRVGLVAFDRQARVLQPPTADLSRVEAALDRLRLGQGTAIGDAVVVSLEAIGAVFEATPLSPRPSTDDEPPTATIVLLSDGETTSGLPNEEAAAMAARAGVPVHTIAFGTDHGTVVGPDGQRVPVPVNRAALEKLAEQAGGEHFPAATKNELAAVYEHLGRATVEGEVVHREVGDWFAGISLVLLALAGVGSLLWFSRLP